MEYSPSESVSHASSGALRPPGGRTALRMLAFLYLSVGAAASDDKLKVLPNLDGISR